MPIEIAKLQDSLNKELQEMQLGLMGKLREIQRDLTKLVPRAYQPYVNSICMELAKNTHQLTETTILTVEDLRDEPTVNAYRNILNGMALSTSSNNIVLLINSLVQSNTTTNAWSLESTNTSHNDLIEKISLYRGMQIKYLSNIIGMSSALELSEKVTDAESLKARSNLAEIVVLKRHEECSNVTKGFGLSLDADLDATRTDFARDYTFVGATQTLQDLYVAQQVQSARLRWMKNIWPEMCVEMTVSPVSRAVSTALYATFESFDVINKLTIDNNFSEQQHAITAVCSGRASHRPTEYERLFTAQGARMVCVGNNDLIQGETPNAFKTRVETAANGLLALNPNVINTLRLQLVVGHGAMNKSILETMKSTCPRNNIPLNTKLNFGEEYWLVVLRDSEGNVNRINFCGIYSRNGQKRFENQPCDLFADYLKVVPEERESYMTSKKDALLDNLDRLVIKNVDELKQVNWLLKKLLSVHLNHIQARQDNPLSKERAIPSDSERAESTPDLPVLQEMTGSSVFGFFYKMSSSLRCAVSNLLSGKYPQQQEIVLTALQKLVEEGASIKALTALRTDARKLISEGKVTKLMDAFIRLKEHEILLTPPNSPLAVTNVTTSGDALELQPGSAPPALAR